MIYIKIFTLLIYLYVFIRRWIQSMHLYQLTHYHIVEFIGWYYKNKTNRLVLVPTFLSLLGVIFLFFFKFNTLLFIELGLGIFSIPFVNYHQEKIRLKWTPRIKRVVFCQILLFLILSSGIFWLTMNHSHSEQGLYITIVFNFLVYDMVLFASIVMNPIERSIQQHFIHQAKVKLNDMNQLTVIGITGSYGKTSTKYIVSEVLSKGYNVCMTPQSFNTPMGITMTINNYLKRIDDFFVCEMGARRMGEIAELCSIASPRIGILTSIGPQHLDTFKNIKYITKTKFELIDSLPLDGCAILNFDNYFIRNHTLTRPVRALTYGIEQSKVDYYALNIRYGTFGSTFEVEFPNQERYFFKTKLLGRHNIYNCLAAIALGDYLKMDIHKIVMAIEQTKPVNHRLELINLPKYNVIDDSFNANIEGVAHALDILNHFETKKIIITPGMIELGESQYEHNYRFGEQIAPVCDYVVLVGKKQTQPILDALTDLHYPESQLYITNTFKEGFQQIVDQFTDSFTVLIENDLPDDYQE